MKINLTLFALTLSTFIMSFHSEAQNLRVPCGLSGRIEERIQDCARYDFSSVGNFVVVTRTQTLKEVHKDLATNHLWGHTVEKANYRKMLKACSTHQEELGYLSGVDWEIPSKEDFEVAHENGIMGLPSMDHWFWSSEIEINLRGPFGRYVDGEALIYDAIYGNFNWFPFLWDNHYSVKCVGKNY
jgi:hypothetical protein